METDEVFVARGRCAAHIRNRVGEITRKQCGDCGKMLPLDSYAKLAKGLGGRQSVCRACKKKRVQSGHETTRVRETDRLWSEGICVMKRCPCCGIWKSRRGYRFVETTRDQLDTHCIECSTTRQSEWRRMNPDRVQAAKNRRRAMKAALPYDLTAAEWYNIRYEKFNDCCALTGEREGLSLDHFVAINTGHGGTVVGNVYPLNGVLNCSKGDANPFEWVQREDIRERICLERFNTLVEYLAEQNDLTVEMFRDFVYWCFANQRSLIDVRRDRGVSSIELFKRRVGD